MNDIEKIKKINEMSGYLKEKGFASSYDEAVQQAEEVFSEKLAQKDEPAQTGGDLAPAEKLERNFEVFKNYTNKELQNLREDMRGVIEKLNEMVQVINRLEKSGSSPVAVQKTEEKGEAQARLDTEQKSSETNQRVGSHKPGDEAVSIEKAFYYGNK